MVSVIKIWRLKAKIKKRSGLIVFLVLIHSVCPYRAPNIKIFSTEFFFSSKPGKPSYGQSSNDIAPDNDDLNSDTFVNALFLNFSWNDRTPM